MSAQRIQYFMNVITWTIGFLIMIGSGMMMATVYTDKITGTFILGILFFLLGVGLLMFGILC